MLKAKIGEVVQSVMDNGGKPDTLIIAGEDTSIVFGNDMPVPSTYETEQATLKVLVHPLAPVGTLIVAQMEGIAERSNALRELENSMLRLQGGADAG
jgi:hypothetical protein